MTPGPTRVVEERSSTQAADLNAAQTDALRCLAGKLGGGASAESAAPVPIAAPEYTVRTGSAMCGLSLSVADCTCAHRKEWEVRWWGEARHLHARADPADLPRAAGPTRLPPGAVRDGRAASSALSASLFSRIVSARFGADCRRDAAGMPMAAFASAAARESARSGARPSESPKMAATVAPPS